MRHVNKVDAAAEERVMAVVERTGEVKEHCKRGNSFNFTDRNYTRAIAEYSEVLKLLPNDDDSFIFYGESVFKDFVYSLRGSCYNNMNQLEKALADFDKAISLNQEDGGYYQNRSVTYLKLGEPEKAAADINKAVELELEKAAQYYCVFGSNLAEQTGNRKEAAVYLKKSVEHGDFYGSSQALLAKWGM